MHIVDATLFFAPHSGGVKRYLLAKQRFLARTPGVRHSVVVPGPRTGEPQNGIVCVFGARIPFGGGYRLPLSLRKWRDTLLALEPDVIEVGDPYHLAWAALAAADRLGIPVVAFAHSDLARLLGCRFGSGVRAGTEAYLRKLYARFDLVLAPSRAIAARLNAIGVANVAVQPLGVDAAIFHPSRRDLGLRAELGLAAATRLLIFAGRMASEKNIPLLRRVFDRLGPPYHLLLVGGERQRHLSNQVTLLPYQQDGAQLARLLASADALIHAGEHETFGMVFIEAMACGRPVIGVRSGAVTELIDASVGLIAEPNDVDSLQAAICALYDRDIAQMGALARARVESLYSWDSTLTLQLQRYAHLMRPQFAADAAGAAVVDAA